jgi:hypothetical protein
MHTKRHKDSQKDKVYPAYETPLFAVNEPEAIYETQSGNVDVGNIDDDFDKALATAITMEELGDDLYKLIDSWAWEDK